MRCVLAFDKLKLLVLYTYVTLTDFGYHVKYATMILLKINVNAIQKILSNNLLSEEQI